MESSECIHGLRLYECALCQQRLRDRADRKTPPASRRTGTRASSAASRSGADSAVHATLLLPGFNAKALEAADAVKTNSGHRLSIVSFGLGSTPDLDVIDALQTRDLDLRSVAAGPLEFAEAVQAGVWLCAAEYELARVFIPVNYQNLRDSLASRYGFADLRDAQLLRLLRDDTQVHETQTGVFRARYRTRVSYVTEAFKDWANLLRDRGHRMVYTYSDLADLYRRLLQPLDGADESDLYGFESLTSDVGILAVRSGADEVSIVVRTPLAQRSVLARGDARFLRHLALAELDTELTIPVDEAMLATYRGAAEVAKALATRPSGRDAERALVDHARLWIRCVATGESRGQSQKWRGWYLVPEHGALTLQKLRELSGIASAIPSLTRRGSVLIDKSAEGVSNAVALLDAGSVTYRGQYSREEKRDLFIRQQKNYLLRLGIAVEVPRNNLALSSEGEAWTGQPSDEDLLNAFVSVLERLRWSWCNMPFFTFALKLAERCDGWLGYHELFNWVVHAYDRGQLDEYEDVIRTYRGLDSARKVALNAEVSRILDAQLNQHLNQSALGHYRRKIIDLMIACDTSGRMVSTGEAEGATIALPGAQPPSRRRSR